MTQQTPTDPIPAPTAAPDHDWSGVRRGPLAPGEWVRLVDGKGRRHNICLEAGKTFHTNKGGLLHDDMIGRDEGFTLTSTNGGQYLVFRPLLSEFVVSMPRGAAVVYPKDAAQIVAMADIFPGAHVVEAGAGSGALTCSLLRAVGPTGRLSSFERREEFAAVAQRNVRQFFGAPEGVDHPAWQLTVGDLVEELGRLEAPGTVDRIVLDMLAPWECVDAVAEALVPGGIVVAYVATTTQLGRVVETLRAHGEFTEPQPWETLVRDWHVEGLAVRPGHKMNGHTGFLVTARRMARGESAPQKKRRPAPGAYGVDYDGPRPSGLDPTLVGPDPESIPGS
ncbi:tRNA (adenine-58-N(1)-) methyltransferase [Nocardioides aurantiacus]|uniref:tRNA (adenine(58)-N(1))-methyltransferase TrmI n=1 Tax=Nocardioides aurantiacus TaxID=86796 RepID=A0A3N2CT48_9ACTN|nr:tRNA (adenine-58-N(1)-) methyltransferase [Nocardioides aurantiacus]